MASEVFFVGDEVIAKDPGRFRFVVQRVRYRKGDSPVLLAPDGKWYDGFWFKVVGGAS